MGRTTCEVGATKYVTLQSFVSATKLDWVLNVGPLGACCANDAWSASNRSFRGIGLIFHLVVFYDIVVQTSCQTRQFVQVTETDAVDAVELGFNRHSADVTTRSMCLVALLKLSSRFPSMSE